MPITKERLAVLTSAGQAIETLYLHQSQALLSASLAARAGRLALPDLCELIEQHCMEPAASIAEESRTLAEEALRWRLTHRKNDRDKRRKERQRGPLAQSQPSEANHIASSKSLDYSALDAEVEAALAACASSGLQPQPARTADSTLADTLFEESGEDLAAGLLES